MYMNVFAIIRRSIWAVILAACIIVGCLYLAFSQTFLTTAGLSHILQQSRIAETVREEVLLPKVLASTRSSDYSALLDDKTVTDAFNATITTEALNAKLTPAVDALQLWLNSKEPSIKFSITMSDLSNSFAAKLAESINAKVASLPQCTRQNTIADAENGVCRSPFITDKLLGEKINEAVKTDPALQENATLSQETVPLPPSSNDLPSYLNMFYAFTLVALGIMVLIGIWLLFKHRFAGIITIGTACLLAAGGLFAVSVLSHVAVARTDDPIASKIIFASVQSLTSILQQEVLFLGIGGIVMIAIGTGALIILKRRRASSSRMQLGDTTNPDA